MCSELKIVSCITHSSTFDPLLQISPKSVGVKVCDFTLPCTILVWTLKTSGWTNWPLTATGSGGFQFGCPDASENAKSLNHRSKQFTHEFYYLISKCFDLWLPNFAFCTCSWTTNPKSTTVHYRSVVSTQTEHAKLFNPNTDQSSCW